MCIYISIFIYMHEETLKVFTRILKQWFPRMEVAEELNRWETGQGGLSQYRHFFLINYLTFEF